MIHDLVSEEVAARLLNVKMETLQKWRSKGINLNYLKIGTRSVRYSLQDIEKFIEESEVKINQTIG